MTEGVQWLPDGSPEAADSPEGGCDDSDDAGTLAVHLLYGEFYPEACPTSHPVGDEEEVCLQIPKKSEGH